MTVEKAPHLTLEQQAHFLEHGWVKITDAVPKEHIELYTKDVWIRNGYDKDDLSTWEEEMFRMPRQREMLWAQFAPKGYSAVCEIVGGADSLDPKIFDKAGDSPIANFGTEEWRNQTIHPKDLGNWHVDGNWFTHFLDSSEQSVLCVILFSDVEHRGGGPFICEDGLAHIINWLHDRPQGVEQEMIDLDGKSAFDVIKHCEKFIECTGKAGDMFICHGFMPHSASKNHRRIPRFITSPKFVLEHPFNLNRENPSDYSLVEQKTLQVLGVPSLPDWKITGERTRFVPSKNAKKDARLPLELERLRAHAAKTGGVVESIHVNGIAEYNGFRG